VAGSQACRNAACGAQGASVFELPAETILGVPLLKVTSVERRSFQTMQSHPGRLPWLCPRAPRAHNRRPMPLLYMAKLALGSFEAGLGQYTCA